MPPPEKREAENGTAAEKENDLKQKEPPFSGNRREPARVKQQWGEFRDILDVFATGGFFS